MILWILCAASIRVKRYSADEIDSLMFEQYLKENHMTLEDYHASQEAFRAKHGYPGYY